MVHLADGQPAANVEGQVQHRVIGAGHGAAGERGVAAVIDDLGQAGIVEEGEVDARGHQHQERVHGGFAQHERPVVRKHVVERLAHPRGGSHAVVNRPGQPADHEPFPLVQKLGPIGSWYPSLATKNPSFTVSGSWGRGRAAGPNTGSAPATTSNSD